MKRTGPTNINARKLISKLKKTKNGLWKRVASDLARPARIRRKVNISRINRHTKEGDVVVVPGKVLSVGDLKHKITIAAFSFSEKSIEKINKSGSKIMSIRDMIKKHPKGSGVRLIG